LAWVGGSNNDDNLVFSIDNQGTAQVNAGVDGCTSFDVCSASSNVQVFNCEQMQP
jgi:hypothetical protein